MRLTCPNCTAQYEIDTDLIPDEGRDVQCSNCSNTWFATKPVPPSAAPVNVDWDAADAAAIDDDDDILDDTPAAESRANWDDTPEDVEQDSEATVAHDIADEDEVDDGSEDDAFSASPELPQRRPVDAAALDILREEADLEIAQRQGDPSPIETQSEAALEEEVEDEIPSRAWKARISRIEDAEAIEERARALDEKAAYSQTKSDLLPDIEDINSSLAPGAATNGSGGFRLGFALCFGVPVLLLALYSLGPTIAQMFPATENFIVAYLDAANAARALISGG